MKESELFKVHLSPNDLFLYLDGQDPKRLFREVFYEPSIFLLYEVIVEQSVINKELKREGLFQELIRNMLKDGLITRSDESFKKHFNKNGLKNITNEIQQMIERTKNAEISIVTEDRDVMLKKGNEYQTSILNPICAEHILNEEWLPPIDAEWRGSYYNWKWDTAITDVKRILTRREVYRKLEKEFSDLKKVSSIGKTSVFTPAIELFPDPIVHKDFYENLRKKNSDQWYNKLEEKINANYHELVVSKDDNKGFEAMRQNIIELSETNKKNISLKNIKQIEKEYRKARNFSGKFCVMRGLYRDAIIMQAIISLVTLKPSLAWGLGTSFPAHRVAEFLIDEISEFLFRRKYKTDLGWFFWFYDVKKRLPFIKVKQKCRKIFEPIVIFKNN